MLKIIWHAIINNIRIFFTCMFFSEKNRRILLIQFFFTIISTLEQHYLSILPHCDLFHFQGSFILFRCKLNYQCCKIRRTMKNDISAQKQRIFSFKIVAKKHSAMEIHMKMCFKLPFIIFHVKCFMNACFHSTP